MKGVPKIVCTEDERQINKDLSQQGAEGTEGYLITAFNFIINANISITQINIGPWNSSIYIRLNFLYHISTLRT